MNKRFLNVRSATLTACAGLVASSLFACSGDDNASPVTGNDAATTDGTAASSASASSAVDASGSTASASSAASSSAVDSSTADATSTSGEDASAASDGAASDAKVEGGGGHHDATAEAAADATPEDASGSADATPEAEAAAAVPMPPNLCGVLDGDFGTIIAPGSSVISQETTRIDGNANDDSGACPPVGSWAGQVQTNFGVADCRLGNFYEGFNGTIGAAYGSDLAGWVQGVLGCPYATADGGPLGYDLIPSTLAGHTFTTADLDLLSSLFVQSINSTIAGQIPLADGGGSALTDAQNEALLNYLHYLETTVPSVVQSSVYTLSTCPVDAGTDAPADAQADGG